MTDESKKPLPEKIFGYWRNDGTDPEDEFLMTSEDPKTLVEENESKRAGVYKLVGYVAISNLTVTTTETKVVEE